MTALETIGYRALRVGMRTAGRLSDGVRLGLDEGFDSGTMVDYIYRNQAHGITPVGWLLDRIYLAHPVWQGVRARRALLIQHLRAALAAYERPVLFDVAAGPGSYLFALPAGSPEYWAGDFDPDEVARGRARAEREGRSDIHFERADAFDPKTWPRQPVDVLVASGFFDILVEDESVERLIDAGTEGSRPGSRWVLTAMEHHTGTDLLRETMEDFHGRPWEVKLRTAEELLERASRRGWRGERVDREPNGFFAVATMRRDA